MHACIDASFCSDTLYSWHSQACKGNSKQEVRGPCLNQKKADNKFEAESESFSHVYYK